MSCAQCEGIERQFSPWMARFEARRFRKKGPIRSTQMLLDALKREGVAGKTLLDVGGGVGVIQHALAEAGAAWITSVDAATNYLETARKEAERRGYADRVTYRHGDFVELASEVDAMDVVTLDRVVCCYDDMPALVRASADRTRDLYGLTYPRETWWLRATRLGINATCWVRRSPFRFFVHPESAVRGCIGDAGLKQVFAGQTLMWNVEVYRRN